MAATLAGILENYRGREKIMRLLQYTSILAGGGIQKGIASERFLIFAEVMSECRTVLRLFDDLAMFVYARTFGLGKQEKDRTIRWTNLVDILCGLTFYPLEHIAWAMDKKLLHGKSAKLWDLALFCWLGSLIACIVRDMWLLLKLHQEELKCHKIISRVKSVDSEFSQFENSKSDNKNSLVARLHQIRSLRMRLLMSVLGFLADLGNAVHWAPVGFLWSGKLPVGCVGLFGTVSSVCELYKYFKPASTVPSPALGGT